MEQEKQIEYSPLWAVVNAERYDRQKILRDIEESTGERVITYISTKGHSMSPDDMVPFMDLFRGIGPDDDVLLVLQTDGGDPNAAIKIVHTIRDGGRKFRVVVPERAKSAGTLLSLGADSIVMGKPSELGPIDPQILLQTRDGATYRPAHSILNGFEDLARRFNDNPSTPLIILAQSIDIAVLDFARKTIEHAEKEASKLLAEFMLRAETDADSLAKSIAHKLADTGEYPSHGYAINRHEADKMGLKIEKLDENDELWKKTWAYYCRAFYALSKSPCQVLYESPRASMMV